MAALDLTIPYITAAEYFDRIGAQEYTETETIAAQLIAVSRLVERSLWLQPGAFQSHTGTYTFDGKGGTKLPLTDHLGRVYLLTATPTDAIGIDTENDATYDGLQWDLDEAWLRGLPENNDQFGEPFEAIEIMSFISGAERGNWPNRPAAVKFTACTFGWAAVPRLIEDFCAHLLHDLRDAHLAGASGELPSMEALEGSITKETWRTWLAIEATFSRKIPGMA